VHLEDLSPPVIPEGKVGVLDDWEEDVEGPFEQGVPVGGDEDPEEGDIDKRLVEDRRFVVERTVNTERG